ncbi:MAG: hypothetical protein Tsb0020_22700 [Haliangiales bacterium]
MRYCALIAAIAALGSFSCAPLSDIPLTGCGDGILDEGEDCDGYSQFDGAVCADADDEDNACAYVCYDSSCPPGWGCGLEGRCVRPSARFVSPSSAPIAVASEVLVIGDADGDGLTDLLSSDRDTMSAHYGDGNGTFPRSFSVAMPPSTGRTEFAYLDNDGGDNNSRLDVVIPLGPVLLAFSGDTTQSLNPIVFPSTVLPTDYSSAAAATFDAVPGVPNEDDGLGDETLVIFDTDMGMFESECEIDRVPLPKQHNAAELNAAGQTAAQIPRADLDGDGVTEFVLAFDGASEIFLFTVVGDIESDDPDTCLRPAPYPLSPAIQLPAGHALVAGGVLLVDIDGDSDRDLLAVSSVATGGPYQVSVATALGDGTYEPATNLMPAFTDLFAQFPAMTRPLAAGDLDGDGRADYILDGGVALALGDDGAGGPTELVPIASPRDANWSQAAVADVNGDGARDVVAASLDSSGVDWFVNASGAGLPGRLNRFHVDTTYGVSVLRVGDFNGDLLADVAVVEAQPAAEPRNQLSVAFSSASGVPSELVFAGTIREDIWALEPAFLVEFGSLELDGISDLMVFSHILPNPDGGGPQALGVYALQGSSAQRLLSPFLAFSLSEGGELPDLEIVAAVVGDYIPVAEGATGPAAWSRGVVVVSIPDDLDDDDGDGEASARAASLTLVSGTEGGELRPTPGLMPATWPLSDFDVECAEWRAADVVDGAVDVDELLAWETGTGCAAWQGDAQVPRAWLLGIAATGTAAERVAIEWPSTYRRISRVRVADFDGDDQLDLVVIAVDDTPQYEVAIFWNDDACGEARFCAAQRTVLPVDIAADLTEGWLDIAPVQLSGDPRPELLFLYQHMANAGPRLGAFESRPAPADGDADESPDPRAFVSRDVGAPRIDNQFDRIDSADIDGDGLIDLLLSRDGAAIVLLHDPGEPIGYEYVADQEASP